MPGPAAKGLDHAGVLKSVWPPGLGKHGLTGALALFVLPVIESDGQHDADGQEDDEETETVDPPAAAVVISPAPEAPSSKTTAAPESAATSTAKSPAAGKSLAPTGSPEQTRRQNQQHECSQGDRPCCQVSLGFPPPIIRSHRLPHPP